MNYDHEVEKYYRPDNFELTYEDVEDIESIHAAYTELEYVKLCEAQINY